MFMLRRWLEACLLKEFRRTCDFTVPVDAAPTPHSVNLESKSSHSVYQKEEGGVIGSGATPRSDDDDDDEAEEVQVVDDPDILEEKDVSVSASPDNASEPQENQALTSSAMTRAVTRSNRSGRTDHSHPPAPSPPPAQALRGLVGIGAGSKYSILGLAVRLNSLERWRRKTLPVPTPASVPVAALVTAPAEGGRLSGHQLVLKSASAAEGHSSPSMPTADPAPPPPGSPSSPPTDIASSLVSQSTAEQPPRPPSPPTVTDASPPDSVADLAHRLHTVTQSLSDSFSSGSKSRSSSAPNSNSSSAAHIYTKTSPPLSSLHLPRSPSLGPAPTNSGSGPASSPHPPVSNLLFRGDYPETLVIT